MKQNYNNGKYLKQNSTWHEEYSPYKAKFCFDILENNKIKFSEVVDVGCGAGLVTELFLESYPLAKITGYDFSHNASRRWLSRKINSNFQLKNNNYNRDDTNDLILCLDVFEHVEDYMGFLKNLSNKSKFYVFNIPLDMNAMKIIFGLKYAREEVEHLHYFNKYTALETFKDTGYEIIDFKLSIAFLKIPPRNIRQLLILPFRILTLIFGSKFAALIFGGISLVVLVKGNNRSL